MPIDPWAADIFIVAASFCLAAMAGCVAYTTYLYLRNDKQ